jgi:hypothetical protein
MAAHEGECMDTEQRLLAIALPNPNVRISGDERIRGNVEIPIIFADEALEQVRLIVREELEPIMKALDKMAKPPGRLV